MHTDSHTHPALHHITAMSPALTDRQQHPQHLLIPCKSHDYAQVSCTSMQGGKGGKAQTLVVCVCGVRGRRRRREEKRREEERRMTSEGVDDTTKG